MEYRWKSYEVSDGLEQLSAQRGLSLRSTRYDSDVSDGFEQLSAQRGLRLRTSPVRRDEQVLIST